jgi:hypothetical protein
VRPIYLQCDCHTAYHCLVIENDPDIAGEINVSFVSTRSGSFWHRVRWALKHVLRRQDLVFADIIIKRDELLDALREGERK